MRKEQTSSEQPQSMPEATPETSAVAPLSPQRAFVVQFRSRGGQAQALFTGRVEHMTSGQAARFESAAELTAFLMRVLAEVREP